jgi:transcriptional regulator CtsR
MENNNIMENYIKTFDDKEKKAYEIARSHLKSSFNIKKSIGYIKYDKSDKSGNK